VAAAAGEVLVRGRVNNPFEKRKKEMARQKRQKEKAERRQQRAHDRETRDSAAPGEDPDIAGIVPGPQPSPDKE
jgi:hypothetical protein